MSSKNHTKNELARISAKIQQLKRKYPVSPELYLSCEKDSYRLGINPLQEIKLANNQSSMSQQRVIRPKSTLHAAKGQNNQSITRNQQLTIKVPKHFLSYQSSEKGLQQNHNFMNRSEQNIVRKEQFIQNRRPNIHSESVQSQQSMEMNFMKQKPYKEYKEELKNLKKQILSGLDITNFAFKRVSNETKIPTIIGKNPLEQRRNYQEQQQLNSKKDKSQTRMENKAYNQQFTMSEVQGYRQRLIQNRQINNQEYCNVDSTERQPQDDENNIERQPSSEYEDMREYVRMMQVQFQNQKQQFQQRISKLQFQSHSMNSQYQQLRNSLLLISGKVQKSQAKQQNQQNKLTQYDLKVVQIQNQAINKLTKDIYKELQTIFCEINAIKENQFASLESQNSQKQQQVERQKMQALIFSILQNTSYKQQQLNQEKFKQLQSKFYKEIFNIKNQLQLFNEKLNKQNMLQKTIKQLIPINYNQKQHQTKEAIEKCKSQLIKVVDQKISILQKQIQRSNKFMDQLILQSNKQTKSQLSQMVCQQLGYFSGSLKEFQTKMTSYSILIEHMQESIKQVFSIVHSQNNQQKSTGKSSKQVLTENFTKRKLSEDIVERNKNQSYSLPTQNIESRSLTSIQNHQIGAHRSDYARSQLQNSKTSHITLPYCLLQECKKQEDQFFITKLGQSKAKQTRSVQIGGFLLEDLVKNSLVFSALNN